MKVFILAGGKGTRLSEVTERIPKPLVEVNGKPLLMHLLEIFLLQGFNDFYILAGYKSSMIKRYFIDYTLDEKSIRIDMQTKEIELLDRASPTLNSHWKVTIIESGLETLTGGRIKHALPFLEEDENFILTYGDGLANVNLESLVNAHLGHGKLATITGVSPPGRFGALSLSGNQVTDFLEKPVGHGSYINGGFFVLNKQVLTYIKNELTVFEEEPLRRLANEGELMAYQHAGYWQCVDNLRDLMQVRKEATAEIPPWLQISS
jgi:glucose-1-phosphate cytidylyltransferase